MPRKAQPRIVRPSGIEQSANGKYFYWKCNISGLQTFADEARFKDVVEKYGCEEKLFKTYVLRPAKKYADAGFDAQTIKEIAKKHGGKLPSLDKAQADKTPVKSKKGPKKGISEADEVKISVVEVEPVKVYVWSGNPDYFKSPAVSLPVGEVTKTACLYPNRQLDNDCRGCSIYAECACPAKFSEEDWKKPSKRGQVKITPIAAFDV